MKVVLEAQYACTSVPWGIPTYTIQLISRLLQRNVYEYGLSYFDENRERNNKKWIEKYFGMYDIPEYECNSISYKSAASREDAFREKSYNSYTGAEGDVFHFMHLISIPDNLDGAAVVTVHDMLPMRFPQYFADTSINDFHLGIKRLHKIQPVIITDSTCSKEDIILYTDIPPDMVHVIPIAYNADLSYPEKDSDTLKLMGIPALFLLYTGRVDDERKNISRIIEAFSRIIASYPDIFLVISGNGDITGIQNEIITRNISNNVILTGYVNETQKRILMSSALAFIYPSLYEGFGLPVIEAMACGAPVITSYSSCMPEIAGDAAILVNPADAGQLAYEMERVIISETLRNELIKKGFKNCKRFSWDKTAEESEKVYRYALERR